MPIKTLGSLGKIRVGRVTGNTHIFFFGLTRYQYFAIICPKDFFTDVKGFQEMLISMANSVDPDQTSSNLLENSLIRVYTACSCFNMTKSYDNYVRHVRHSKLDSQFLSDLFP